MNLRSSVALALPLALALATAAKASGGPDPLLAAYQKEYAFLEAEKHALQARLDEARKAAEARKAQARAEIAALERRLVLLSVDADQKDARLADKERQMESEGDASDSIGSILGQARALLGDKAAVPVEGTEDALDAAALAHAFTGSLALLEERSEVRREPGSFFDKGGQRVEGTVLKLGEIAAFGDGASAAGPLAPAGAGQLKIWPSSTEEHARALLKGERPGSLQLFLFEDRDKAIEPPKDKSALEVVEAGGTIAWVIVGLGLVALLLVALRLLALLRAGAGAASLLEQVSTHVRLGNFEEALSLLKGSTSAMGSVLRAAVQHRALAREARTDRVDEAILRSFALIDRFGTLILVMAAVAPLLGLLGTVTGMIATFDAITEFGTGDPRVLAGGISEALITTELGLIVAIPALLLGNLLSGMGERLKRQLETGALSVANLCDEGGDAEVLDELLGKAA